MASYVVWQCSRSRVHALQHALALVYDYDGVPPLLRFTATPIVAPLSVCGPLCPGVAVACVLALCVDRIRGAGCSTTNAVLLSSMCASVYHTAAPAAVHGLLPGVCWFGSLVLGHSLS